MDKEKFEKHHRKLASIASRVRTEKRIEYFGEDDVLAQFRDMSQFRYNHLIETIFNLGAKSLQSLSQMIREEFTRDAWQFDDALWDEKFADALNYLLITYAAIQEDRGR